MAYGDRTTFPLTVPEFYVSASSLLNLWPIEPALSARLIIIQVRFFVLAFNDLRGY